MPLEGYVQDLKSGYLTPGPAFVGTGVTAEQKIAFLDVFRRTANFTKAAKLAGCSRPDITSQFEGDLQFYNAYRFAVEAICDQAESNLFELSKRNPTACFGLLKAFRPAIWADKKDAGNAGTSVDKLKGLLEDLKKEGKLLDVKEESK